MVVGQTVVELQRERFPCRSRGRRDRAVDHRRPPDRGRGEAVARINHEAESQMRVPYDVTFTDLIEQTEEALLIDGPGRPSSLPEGEGQPSASFDLKHCGHRTKRP